MKLFLVLLFIMAGSGEHQGTSLSEVRNLYQKASKEERAGIKLLKLTKGFDENNPVFLGYYGAAHMIRAKYVFNPFSKMSHFNKGKNLYSQAIEADPENIELRFLRFAVQSETPFFLGYKENLEEDKKFLLSKIKRLRDLELYEMIVAYLRTSELLSPSEKEKLE